MEEELVIGIRGTFAESHVDNYRECLKTWGKVFKDRGYTVKVLLGLPALTKDYHDVGDYLFSNALDDYDHIFQKTIYYPYQWFLKETKSKYFFITDSDTFIHPDRFISRLEEVIKKYPSLDYWGSPTPWQGQNFGDLELKIAGKKGVFGSGGCGFLVSRRAAKIVVDNALEEIKNYDSWWFDDYIVGNILQKENIDFVWDTSMIWVSPWKGGIYVEEGYPPIPFIGGEEGNYLIAQHYMDGKMELLMNIFKY
tara:strand:- start:491 stop:1246 length:756 start_codon:yes stop_codon:yes gene_type:complete